MSIDVDAKPTVQLHLGDCLEYLKTLDVGSIDAVVTDPPYGMKWNTDSTRFCGGMSGACRYKGQGRSDWNAVKGDDAPFDPSPWLDFPKVAMWGVNHYAARLPAGTTLVWIKKADHLFGTFLSDAEIGWMKGGHGVYCHRLNFATPTRRYEGGGQAAHPTQKPIGLMAWCLKKLRVEPGDTVLDPFMGSGTTGVACVKAGVNFIGCEIDPSYFAVAKRRIAEASTTLF